MFKKYIVIVVSAIILATIIPGCSTEENEWLVDIEHITAQVDAEQSIYSVLEAYEYTATIDELERFYIELTRSFESGEYLKVTDKEELLIHMFKAMTLTNQATGDLQQFAIKYLDNLRYTYLEVDEPMRDQVLANEQMMAAILENAS